jgi:hypothetical protein
MAISLSLFSCWCLFACLICSAMNVASASTSGLPRLLVSSYVEMAIKHKCVYTGLTYPVRSIISTSSSENEGPTALERPPNGIGVVRRDLLDSRPISILVDSKSRFRFRRDSEAGLTPSVEASGLLGVSITPGVWCDLEGPATAGTPRL